ncbi:hypothetical protein MBLNU230_g0292t1 [Neophaeotheca triangularis]
MAPKPNPKHLIRSKAEAKRPVLTHLNEDNSWLLQVPTLAGPRPYFNIVLDPWLVGDQIEIHDWVHKQSTIVEAAFRSMAEVEEYANEVSDVAAKYLENSTKSKLGEQRPYGIDVVALSIYISDHTHKVTLLELPPSVVIVGHPSSVKLVKTWNYFDTVCSAPLFANDWRESQHSPLPPHIGIAWLKQTPDPQGVHVGLAIFMETNDSCNPETVLLLPHGIQAAQLRHLTTADPPVSVLALLHGTLRVPVGLPFLPKSDANLGAHNGLAARRLLDAKYWIPTCDAEKKESGLTSWIIYHEPLTVEDALKKERLRRRDSGISAAEGPELPGANFYLVANGEGMVLM